MKTLTLILTLIIMAAAAWLLVDLKRSQVARRWLWFVVPALMALPIGFYVYGMSLMGLATDRPLPQRYEILDVSIIDKTKTVYVLVMEDGEVEPRLHAIRRHYKKRKEQFGEQQSRINRGMRVTAEAIGEQGGDDEGGEYRFYALPPARENPKGN